jgi:hypothetical protein
MIEYAMAKLAGEALCLRMNRALPRIRILAPRLPRTLTDQTASVIRADNADPLAVMLPIVRDMHQPEP